MRDQDRRRQLLPHERPDERKELRRKLTSGVSVQMFAPRRVGKTWLLRRFAEDLEAEGWETIFIDLEGMRTEEEFLGALCRKLEAATDYANRVTEHLKQRLKQLMISGWEGGNPIHAIGKLDAKQFSEALIAALDAQQRRAVILVDEVALFVAELIKRDADAAKAFLYHLRGLQQAYPRVLWLLTGSIGLDVVARRAGMQGALVDLNVFVLEPFDPVAARSYLDHLNESRALRRPFSLDAEAFAHLAEQIGWLAPFYLQMVADRVVPTGPASSGKTSATRADIDRAIEELLRPEYRTLFAPLEEHIDKNFPAAEARQLRALLDACCQRTDGEIAATLLARIQALEPSASMRQLNDRLTALATSGHLTFYQDRWRFRSGLFRRYWLKYNHE